MIETLTYEQAEDRYRTGRISQEVWERFCYRWRNSAFRFSSLAQSYERGEGMKIMGIDPGTKRMGWATIEGEEWKAGALEVDPGPIAQRLFLLGHALERVFHKAKPDVVVVEKAYVGKNPHSALRIAEARAVALIVAASFGCVVHEVNASEAKAALTGKGNAKKPVVAQFAERLGRFNRKLNFEEGDACALAFLGDSIMGQDPPEWTGGKK